MVYKPKKEYSWGEGYSPKVKASVVGETLEQIESECGIVTKEEFLERSRDLDSPTHDLFEWNDSKAAEQYRLNQSQQIIGHLKITYVNAEKKEQKIRAYVNVSDQRFHSGYMATFAALSDDEKKEIVLGNIRKELDQFVERNKAFEGLADLLITKGKSIKKRESA